MAGAVSAPDTLMSLPTVDALTRATFTSIMDPVSCERLESRGSLPALGPAHPGEDRLRPGVHVRAHGLHADVRRRASSRTRLKHAQ